MSQPPPLPNQTAVPARNSRTTTSAEATGPERLSSPDLRPAAEDSESGRTRRRTFGRYELLMELGSGGMATLHLARLSGPQQFQKLLAVKKIHEHLSREPDFLNMFLDEARIAALIHHPNVATIFDLGHIKQNYYITMEYVHGQNLAEVLKAVSTRRHRFPWTYAVRIVADGASGLHAAHTLCNTEGQPLNVVHRDVSPQNFLLSYDGHVKVVDFGIAYAAEKLTHTDVGILKGKTAYMSPEQAEGHPVDRRSDIFALGIVLYEAVTLTRLFKQETDTATLLRVQKARVPRPKLRNPDIPDELERIILKALSRSPDERFDTAAELSEQLNALLLSHGEMVSSQKLAALMGDLFGSQRKFMDQQIKAAMRSSAHPAALPDEPIALPERVNPYPYSSPNRWSIQKLSLLAASALAFVVAATILALLTLRRDEHKDTPVNRRELSSPRQRRQTGPPVGDMGTPRSEPTPQPPGNRPVRPKPAQVALKVFVRPAAKGITIRFRGRNYKGPTHTLVVPASGKKERLTVRAPGHRPTKLTVALNADRTVKVKLRRLRRKRTRRARRRGRRRRRAGGDLRNLPD